MKNHILFFMLIASIAAISSNTMASSSIASFDRDTRNTIDFVRPSFREARNPRAAFRIVDGAATKGPIANAGISVYEIDDTGTPVGSAVATSTTSSSGEFSVNLPASASGMLLVKTSGGSFIDESDTRPLDQRRRISLGSGEGFMSIILNSQSSVAVTPYTDAMVERALGASNFGGFKTKMQDIMAASTDGFGFSIFETLPADPAAPSSTADSAQMEYALLLGATANIANVAALKMGMAAPTFEVLKAMVYDLSDGSNDGLQFGLPIMVNGKAFPEVDFDQQLNRFRNNNFSSYSDTSLPGWESAEQDLGGLFSPGEFYAYTILPLPALWGLTVQGSSKTIRRGDGSGTYLNATGKGDFIWGEDGETLIIDFTPFGGFLDEYFAAETFTSSTYVDRFIVTENSESGVDVIQVGRTVFEDLTTGDVSTSSFETSPAQVLVKRKEELYLIDEEPPEFEENPALPMLTNGREPTRSPNIYNSVDGMTFTSDGRGVTDFQNVGFDWQLSGDRRALEVNFDNGESAIYHLLLSEDEGEPDDFVVAEYTTADGKTFFNSQAVYSNFEGLVWTPDLAVGYLRGEHSSFISSLGRRIPYERSLYLYPNGTGVIESTFFFNIENADHVYGRGSLCWDIDENSILNIRYGAPGSFSNGFAPTPEDCAALVPNSSNVWSFELYDDPEGEFKTVIAETFPGETELYGIFPIRFTRAGSFTAQPPIPVDDVHNILGTDSLTINPLENDVVNLSLDSSSVTVSTPFNISTFSTATDTVSVNPTTGEVTITPDPTDSSPRDIEMNYRVTDTSGNTSTRGRIFISIEPSGSNLPPLSSLSGVYSGSYSWDCGSPDLSGSTSMTLDISNEEGFSDVFGTVTIFGGSTSVSGSRLNLPSMGAFGFEGGTLDPNGMYVHLFYSEIDNLFVENELSLEITETGLVGIARNGESDVGGGTGCALSSGAVGTIDLTKQATALPRRKSRVNTPAIINNSSMQSPVQ